MSPTSSPPAGKSELTVLNTSFEKLKKKPTELTVEKIVDLSLLEKETKESGHIWLSSNKLRVELKGESKSILVYDGKIFWVEQIKPEDLGGGTLVSKISGLKLKTNSVFRLFISSQKISDTFKFVKKTKLNNDTEYELEPKKFEDFPDAAKLKVLLSGKDNRIIQMTYFDELENRTTYKFVSQKTLKNIAKSKFSYSPANGAEVTEL